MHRMFRGAARTAAIAALIVSSGALVAVPPAIADIGADIGLVCSGKAGTHQVALRIDSTIPSSGAVGQPVQLGTIKVDVSLPPELVKEVEPAPSVEASAPPVTGVTPSSAAAPALGGVAEIQVAVRGPGGDRRGGWPAFALAAAPPRGDGAVHLTGSGVAPPVVPESPGGLSWSAGAVGLSLVPDDTAGQDSEELALRCAAEKETVLGTVQVRRESGIAVPGASSASPRQAAAPEEHLCETIPARGEDPRYAISDDPKLKEIYESPETPSTLFPMDGPGEMYCIKATGFFNVKKAGNAVPVAVENNVRALTTSYVGNPLFGPNWSEFHGYFVNQTYPTPATMLGFGFMPTRATATALQVGAPGSGAADPITGNMRILQRLATFAIPDPTVENQEIRANAYIRIKADQAEVNGVPLDLGDKCTTSPTLLSASGFMGNLRTGTTQYDQGQTLIAQDFAIPAFSNCGVGEDLSPILTASVSGTGNYANLESGQWCIVINGHNCVDGAGALPRTFTVNPGGTVTAVARPFTLTQGNAEFRCESATMQLDMDRGHWQSRFRLAKGDMSLAGCEVESSDGVVHQVRGEVTQDGALWMNMITNEIGNPEMRINGVLLNATVDLGGSQTCTLRISEVLTRLFPIFNEVVDERPADMSGTYDNGTFSVKTHFLKPSMKSTCSIPGFTDFLNGFTSIKADFAFDPVQQITTP
ncbi:hypothetical protein [Actinomadura sp. 7K534]|uniref:hypothetical protein n=1 Tax=Actinomadura sp. 7K534 TaxID=2530366 RepID=UPI00104B3DA0|nr:hypothetical protein [Actinomadura sp. 7K534]TDB96071.1 hypothetical protein E1266_11165 [Actinomadura sp. 7K534]